MKANVEITCGEPIIDHNPTNCFQLVLEYSHGDADGKSEKTILYTEGEIEDLKQDYAAVKTIDDFGDKDKIKEYYQGQGMSEDEAEDAASDFRDNFHEGDHTTDYSETAACSSVELFWYDAGGVKHDVKVKIDGEEI
ncbi:hypothetical protein [Acinetobacter sp.]|uniref:hypothetical protein n=1 Tax=Acinetobacter sp. TaxID=472 RepID=UPI00388D778D